MGALQISLRYVFAPIKCLLVLTQNHISVLLLVTSKLSSVAGRAGPGESGAPLNVWPELASGTWDSGQGSRSGGKNVALESPCPCPHSTAG